jgi:hypothetical protein
MVDQKRLHLLVSGMIRKRPYVTRFSVVWPWHMDRIERESEANACRGEHLNVELLDQVLEAKTLLGGVTRRKRTNAETKS